MIVQFPDPYEGELLYSTLARFSDRMGYSALNTTLLELFRVRHGIPTVELPNKIDQLVSALPPGTLHTSDSLIQETTLLPFYAPFLPDRSYELIVNNMKGGGTRTTQLRAGIIAGRVSPPEFFRTCPICDQENLARCGEAYWQRLHQIRGVEVCPTHGVFLEPTNVRRGSGRLALLSAESACRATIARPMDPESTGTRVLLRVAASTAWLLTKNASRPGLDKINRRYREVLDGSGYLSPGGWIRLKRLRGKIAECCPTDLLKQFNCELGEGRDGGWLARLLRETEQAIAPMRHLLLMSVLGLSAQEFFDGILTDSTSPRRPSLFPCLNRICPRYREPVIPKFELKRAKHGFARIFECPHCGHRTSRGADGGSVIRVVGFGQLWQEKLRLLWADASRSLQSISAELNADIRSLKNYAAKLGLEFPRRGPRLTTSAGLYVARRPLRVALVNGKRKGWLELRAKNPVAGIGFLHRIASGLYIWLYRHDRQWLNENSPPRRPFVVTKSPVDWVARDKELAGRVASMAGQLKSNPHRSRRVTVRWIGTQLRMHTLLQVNLHRLPNTKLALQACVETTEQFALYRVRRAVNHFVAHRTRATHSDILRAAGIGPTTGQMHAVRQALLKAKECVDHCLDRSNSPVAISPS
jgi:hypothetical protein